MANATVIDGRTIHITLDGSTDWAWDSSTEKTAAPELNELSKTGRLWVHSISFRPGATDDKVIVREGSLSGAGMFSHIAATAYDTKTQLYDLDFAGLYIANGDVTSTAATLIVVLM